MSHPEQDATLEWIIRDLKRLFQQGKEGKEAEAVESDSFGNGQWRVLFYPNDNAVDGDSISVYLSCEPTEREKEKALNGEWQREGYFNFRVELWDTNKKTLIKKKEAFSHAFSWKTATWGWSQFVSRNAAYHSLDEARQQDAFTIVCRVTESKHTS